MELFSALSVPSEISVDEFVRDAAEEIIRKYEKAMISKTVSDEFSFASEADRSEIAAIAVQSASADSGEILASVHYNRRRALIEEALKDYFAENDLLNLDGFIKFRLGDYKEELRRICFSAADEFAAKREYDEFLDMLRFFVSVQSPREELVHVVKKGSELRILSKRKKDITELYAAEFAQSGEELTDEDIALSALIAIAPGTVIIHGERGSNPLFDTIEAIFDEVKYRR